MPLANDLIWSALVRTLRDALAKAEKAEISYKRLPGGEAAVAPLYNPGPDPVTGEDVAVGGVLIVSTDREAVQRFLQRFRVSPHA